MFIDTPVRSLQTH